MQQRWFLSFLSLAGLSPAQADPAPGPFGDWTLSGVHRTKSADKTLCDWHFTVSQSAGGSVTKSSAPGPTFACAFNVTTASPGDCGLSSWSAYPCTGNAEYTINGGHNDEGFIVLTLLNQGKQSQAFFGYTDGELDGAAEIQAQTRPAIHEYMAVKRDGVDERRWESDGEPVGNWTVQDMFRDVDVEKHTITVGFTILDGTAAGSRCMLVLTPPEGVDMQTWEWYNKKCEESGYYASWGYLNTQNAGIMTLVNSDRDSEAFFGFPDISSGAYLGDAGPNPVTSCNCG
ncbi:hypothetical protein GGR53DRAFT_399232 [Hypoxylon sp. FL1150]|nr:hypothetical protein GGR53DRAFT_399232 [Hypoxylon sp. FL1150]